MNIIGVGGMGVVFGAKHVILDKPVAIKVLNQKFASREGGEEQFLREARASSRIRHPNVIDVTDFGTAPDGMVFFVMEYLEGISLEDILARDVTIPLFNAVNIIRQIAHALAAAHEEGVVHRDLKPENIYLTAREGRRQVVRRISKGDTSRYVVEKENQFDFVKLLDFGVAKYKADDMGPSTNTRNGIILGTPQYMSPEQARGEEVDGRSDIYAVGVLFYEMITGYVPFDGETALDILNGHVSGKLVPPKDVNPQIKVDEGTNRTIVRCLQKRPDDRFDNMDGLLQALVDCFTDQVFLRDVHVMPGAVEAGITPPQQPAQLPVDNAAPPAEQESPPDQAADGPPPPKHVKTITDDLGDLFAPSPHSSLDAILGDSFAAPVEAPAKGGGRAASAPPEGVEVVATGIEAGTKLPGKKDSTKPAETSKERNGTWSLGYPAVTEKDSDGASGLTKKGIKTLEPDQDPVHRPTNPGIGNAAHRKVEAPHPSEATAPSRKRPATAPLGVRGIKVRKKPD